MLRIHRVLSARTGRSRLRRFAAIAVAALTCGVANQAIAQETTYTFSSAFYQAITNANGACTVGECATYTTGQRAIVTLTFAAPLAANLPAADRRAAITAYSLSDGVRTTTGPSGGAAILLGSFGTDATGTPVSYDLLVERTPGPPYTTSTPTDPNSRLSYVEMRTNGVEARGNYVCYGRGGGAAPGTCSSAGPDPASSTATTTDPTVVTRVIATPAAVPTLSEWAMILFGIILASGAALGVQRRRVPA
ncbi:IPTL-CTERM sorting domain-containing protein [Brevundimonas sp. NIBR11]|uniref:IPTL-CTERM sorting domain-containing protein n=1 Tax=Brevundimonas sp. NIBR11 TaxID=3015999 RepID=UPI0022F0663C|nr:IPTL-CTERM sorting domain-containing protein [Brevundimonas sp. NIBR11]WGM30073.1 hypothetical protein KKHFBJBL_00288 [Brevundimonas sp. NIBR11]